MAGWGLVSGNVSLSGLKQLWICQKSRIDLPKILSSLDDVSFGSL